ncbi:MarR family winged helix-turn-helix transcriptional regulator [Actinocrispum sp. NPDC049592]|uniref:MarR family winged helix-turn-helix transcriptional regulator n=1 Tax=Actinocrispum sp. NPDC049592 TaxID=3154835 RepID=UPI0034463BA4
MRPPTLLALPSYLAGHVSKIGRQHLDQALSDRGLRPPHFAVLAALADFGPLVQHEVADRLGLNRSHLVGYLDVVEHLGLVCRERDPDDRRRQHVLLTPAGRQVFEDLVGVAVRAQDEYLGALTEPEREVLIDLLRRIVLAEDEE